MSSVSNIAFLPASEAMARLVVLITETVHAAADLLFEQDSLREVTTYLEKVKPILTELSQKNVADVETVRKSIEIMERELLSARNIISTCSNRSKFYLLLNCRNILKKLQNTTREIGYALNLLPFAMLEVSLDIEQKTNELCHNMQNAIFKAAVSEEEIIDKIELGIRERQNDVAYANNLLLQIAKVMGIPDDTSTLKQEFDEFKKDMEETKLRKNQAEALQMEQIIGLLSWADAATSSTERDKIYHEKKLSLGTHPLPPLQSFYCPITQEVMEDPVEIHSGQTFERASIEKWLADGHTTCPLTNQVLVTKELRPNIILRRSIEEWKDRNAMITIASLKSNLDFTEEKTVLVALDKLLEYSEEKDRHKHYIAAEGYIPILIGLLRRNKPIVRKRTLALLCSLIKDNDDNKVRISQVDHAIEFIVRSLSRDISEGSKAVCLLFELSRNSDICKQIGKAQGCIFLLVTMSNSDNSHAGRIAKEILKNLSYSEHHIIQMAEANYFKPMLQKLIEGSRESKICMASALSHINLTDKNKVALLKEGVVTPILKMLSDSELESKSAAIGALEALSSLPENAVQMIKQGVGKPILDLLCMRKSSVMALREKAANIYLNFALSTKLPGKADAVMDALAGSNAVICQLLSTINLTPPTIQGSLIQAFEVICSVPSETDVRAKLNDEGAFTLILPFCEAPDHQMRADAVKLLNHLCQDGNKTMLAEHLGETYTKYFANLLRTSADEERAATLGIIGNLPLDSQQITDWLLEARTLPLIISLISSESLQTSGSPMRNGLVENAVGILCRFTLPSDIELQLKVASYDVIPVLVRILSYGTSLAKSRAASSLAQLSQNSGKLSKRIKSKKKILCFSTAPESRCHVHGGFCSVKTSFCLIEADAIDPLVEVLNEGDELASEAALKALSTLLDDEYLEKGATTLEHAGALKAIIRLLDAASTDLQERAVWITERVLRMERYRLEYGSIAQMALIDITQKGTSVTKPLAAKTLAHLNIIHEQSTYF
eukprot:TRINITY_DN12995_c0_g1_i1.p1 TRINITY_DN12995_c0_g1~~TRINITY_DN12995_c0_g1_i1.p1  ORF type:complete len:1010 (-),score=235.47 TRINITY_DN12995_c0_g1_i1:261-3290(-)